MTTQQQEYLREAWDAIAAGFDEFITPTNMRLAEMALQQAGVGPGMRVLDVAAGSGAVAIPAARLGARVLATDISPVMVEHLQARAHHEGLSSLEAQVMDGQALDIADDTFDVTASQFGIMLFPDLPQGLRELVRVTKPGGRGLIVAFGPPTKAEFLGFFLGAIQAVVPGFTGLPMDPPPLPFQVADPEKLRQAMAEAGLRDIRIETFSHEHEFQSGAHMWDAVRSSNPIGAAMAADLTWEQVTAVKQVLDGMLRERSGGTRGATLTAEVNVATGTA